MSMRRCALLGLVFAISAAGYAQEENFQRISVQISLDRSTYFRGAADPVHGLVVTMTVKNTEVTEVETVTRDIEQIKWVNDGETEQGVPKQRKEVTTQTIEYKSVKEGLTANFPAPSLGGEDTISFEIVKLGGTTGEKAAEDGGDQANMKKTIARSPPQISTGRTTIPNTVTLAPEQSKEFQIEVGKYYNIQDAGVYEVTALFQSVGSNTVMFEVLPVKKVNVRKDQLLRDIRTYERGLPKYAYMFYICPTSRRWDELFYMVRHGKGEGEKFEQRDLCTLKRGSFPQVATLGRDGGDQKIAFLVDDRADAGLRWLYIIDFSRKPVHVERTAYKSPADAEAPRLVADGDTFRVEDGQGNGMRSVNQPE